MIPTNNNSGSAARNAAARLGNLASGVDEVVRTLKRDGQGNAQLLAMSTELDKLR